MIKKFKKDNIDILKIYYCPHNWNENCTCRKPKPGMLLKASEEYYLRLENTVFVGDDNRDLMAAQNANCNGILWKNNKKFQEIHDLVKKSLNNINR